jgi:uncharacterized membrane protein YgdD (TMEM256/DUF423 family)
MGIYAKTKGRNVKIITMLFAFGILLFSGSIYLLCIMKSTMHIGLGGLGILTPHWWIADDSRLANAVDICC